MNRRNSLTNSILRIGIVVLIGAAVMVAGASLASAQSRGPRVKTHREVFDFGVVPQHSEVSHVFWLRNTGDETLVIDDVIPNCGCSEAPIEKKHVEPGDSTRVELIFGSSTYEGTVSKFAQVVCNGEGRVPALTFVANVVADSESIGPIVATPRRIVLGEEQREELAANEWTTSVQLKNTGDSPVDITMIDKPDRAITVEEYNGTLAPGAEHTLSIRFTKDLPEQTFSRSVTLEISDPSQGRLTVPIFKKEAWGSASAGGKQAKQGN